MPANSNKLVVVPGREDECWTRIVRANKIEAHGPRHQGIAQLCAIAARALAKPVADCTVPDVESSSKAVGEPAAADIISANHPDVTQILEGISRAYHVTEYELIGDGTSIDPKTEKREPYHVVMAFSGPNRYRMEGAGFDLGIGDTHDAREMVLVYDGSSLWFYVPKGNQYGSISADKIANADDDLADARPEAFDGFVMGTYRHASDSGAEAKFLREETIQLGDKGVECYVLSVAGSTWWVDKDRNSVVRQEQDGTIVTFETIKLGEPLPADLFRFVPPPGATRITTGIQ
ncbi:MAG TPA: hypothetical protein VFW44_10045 [Bryobacteraceae bacterium]|nr:hypothetical protein [Bryobacteraceae bacterium]